MRMDKQKIIIKYSLLFIITACVIFSVFIVKRLSFVLRDDGYNQYYPVFVYTGRYYRCLLKAFLAGNQIPVYDFSIGLGGDILTYLNKYGITDIFNIFFSTFCPAKYSVYGYSLALIAKMYVAGISFLIYCRYRCFNMDSSIIGALSYSFSTFALAYGLAFPEFMFPMMTLPIFILGIDSIITGDCSKKIYILFVCAVFFQSLTGFYMLYMECIFCISWIIAKSIFFKKNIRLLTRIIRIIATSAISVGLSSFVLVPTIFLFLSSTRNGESSISIDNLISFYDGAELASRFSSFSLGQWAMGLGIPVIGLISVYRLIKTRDDKPLLLVTALWIICYFNSGTGIITNGFSYSVDRYIFLIFFAIAVVIAEQLPKIDFNNLKLLLYLTVFYSVWAFCTMNFVSDSRGNLDNRIILYLISNSIMMILFKLCANSDSKINQRFRMIISVLTICIIGTMYNMPFKYGGVGWYEMFMYYKQPYESIVFSQYGDAANSIQSEDNDDFARIDVGETSIGASLFTSTYSTSVYLSIIEPFQYEFYSKYGISSAIKGNFILQNLDGRSLLQKILSVKYYKETINSELEKKEDSYPLGIIFDSYIDENEALNYDVVGKNYLIDKTVILNNLCNIQKYMSNISCSENVQFTKTYKNIIECENTFVTNESSVIILSIDEMQNDYEYYICMNEFMPEDGTHDIIIADKKVRLQQNESKDQDNSKYIRVSYEYLKKNNGKVSISFDDEGTYTLKDIEIKKINISDKDNIGVISTLQNVTFNGKTIVGNYDSEKEGILFMNIPFSKGWNCYVDGEKKYIYVADYGFMAVEVPIGTHKVVWEYDTPGKKIGELISGLCLIMIATILFIKSKKHSEIGK